MNFLVLLTVIIIAVLIWKAANLLPDLTYQLRELRADVSTIKSLLSKKKNDEGE